MNTYIVEFELEGMSRKLRATVEAGDPEQARVFFAVRYPRGKIVSVTIEPQTELTWHGQK